MIKLYSVEGDARPLNLYRDRKHATTTRFSEWYVARTLRAVTPRKALDLDAKIVGWVAMHNGRFVSKGSNQRRITIFTDPGRAKSAGTIYALCSTTTVNKWRKPK